MALAFSTVKPVVLVLVAALAADYPLPAQAEQSRSDRVQIAEAVVVPDGRFASMQDYLAGTWAATRPATHVGWRIQFTRGGEFRFNAQGAIVSGRYEARPNAIRMLTHRACNASGNCQDRNPPIDNTYPMRLLNANEYESGDEHWRRISRE